MMTAYATISLLSYQLLCMADELLSKLRMEPSTNYQNNGIENSEFKKGEYMFIDIIEPITELINFTAIENILSKIY